MDKSIHEADVKGKFFKLRKLHMKIRNGIRKRKYFLARADGIAYNGAMTVNQCNF